MAVNQELHVAKENRAISLVLGKKTQVQVDSLWHEEL